MEKHKIRKEIFQKRQEISQEEVKILSRKVFVNVKKYLLNIEKETTDLFAYFSCNHEVDTTEFLCERLSQNKQTALPRVGSDGYCMDFYYIDCLADVEKGYKGIFEPKKSCVKVKADNSKNRIILVPGVGFDRRGNRVGYGKGFYDRYLEKHNFQKTIGIAFEFQIFNSIEYMENDIRLDAIITEEQIYEVAKESGCSA